MSDKVRRLARRTLPDVWAQFARMVDARVGQMAVRTALGLKRSTYYKWLSAYRRGGLAALEVRPAPGGPTKLTDRQESQLRGWLASKDPRQFQFDFALWTRRIVRDLIRQRFGITAHPKIAVNTQG